MQDIDVEIEAKTLADVELLVEILKRQYLTTPVYIIRSTQRFYLRYNIDYETDQIESDVERALEGYRFAEHFNIWNPGIRMIIRKIGHPSSDGWGRPLDGFDKTEYLIHDAGQIEEKIDPNFKILFGDALEEYKIEISTGINPKTQQRGFLIVDDDTDEKGERRILINKLYPNTNEAFWAGLKIYEEGFQSEFEERRKKAKRKAKGKKTKKS